MIINDDDYYLAHYGTPRHSGRYPWGSGGNPNQHHKDFLSSLAELRSKGMTDPEIAKGWGITTTQLRQINSIEKNKQKQSNIREAVKLKDKGWSNVAIGEKMGIPESSVRNLLKSSIKEDGDILTQTADMLRQEVNKGGFIDIGVGVSNHLAISSTKLDTAVAVLKSEGYVVHKVQVDQLGTNQKTTIKVLCPPGTRYPDVVTQMELIRLPFARSTDGGRSWNKTGPPLQLDSKRVQIAYREDGGAEADGVLYVRPGVADLSLGGSRYAQVRVAVDGTHYMKGMAIYKDDLPPGVDVVYNTNKTKGTPALGPKNNTVLKPLKDDPENPFGAIYDQIGERDAFGNITKVTSAMNIVNEEGRWGEWSKSISTQVLSKQSPTLAKTQLDMVYDRKKRELDEIMSLTNPAVRKKLLLSYADDADSSAIHLKAAHLPRQASQVILPIKSLKETEIYAPNFRNGERVALIRHPHGGIFEIPELTVNNKHPESKAILGDAKDAVGINSKVAERLSGADFDGDTVLVIPNPASNPRLKTAPPLEGLKGFDPQRLYKLPEGQEFKGNTQVLMGDVSNLITDMTIKKASSSELARAVRHSMVVIDAEKHGLDHKQSALDNGILDLKRKYQARDDGSGRPGGAATLISRAKSPVDVRARRPRPAAKGGPIDPATGRKMYEDTGESWIGRNGETVYRTMKSKKLAETDDARTLSSGTQIEEIYATHSNRLKSLANTARKELISTPKNPYSSTANKAYADEVQSLAAKLDSALRNRPLERQAQLIANTSVALKKQATPNLDPGQLKKVKAQALEEARARVQAKKPLVKFEGREWEAIQAGAIRNNMLDEILKNADLDQVKALATPRTPLLMTSALKSRAKQMAAAGYTQAEIADGLGVSLTTLKEGLK